MPTTFLEVLLALQTQQVPTDFIITLFHPTPMYQNLPFLLTLYICYCPGLTFTPLPFTLSLISTSIAFALAMTPFLDFYRGMLASTIAAEHLNSSAQLRVISDYFPPYLENLQRLLIACTVKS